MKVPYAKAPKRRFSVREQQQETFFAKAPRFGIDWPPYGYWTDEELAEMSRPRRNFNHDNRSV